MSRPLLLSGFMATGKTAVGRLVAEASGARFVDLDQLIVEKTGKSIREIFADLGESGFREEESRTLDAEMRSAEGAPLVIALGGGALLDRARRVEILSQAVVVTLTASPEEIVRRATLQDGDTGARPLLSGEDRNERVKDLLAVRRNCYAEAHAQILTEGRTLSEIAAEVRRHWERDAVCVAAGEQSYCVLIGSGLIRAHLEELVAFTSGVLLVTDTNVDPLHGDKARDSLSTYKNQSQVVLTPGEEHKNLEGLSQILEAAFLGSMDRKSTLVGLGGGVVTDMTGFAAATWVRGVRWVGAPTTLLSMVDASVGGKTAVDFRTAKNSVGAFWQPSGVICDVDTLQTETRRAYVGALSEVVKTALIGDPELLTFLDENATAVLARDPAIATEVVKRCVRVKARIVGLDERESGIRATLNLGHTIGHALEASGGYTGLTHGEAVSLGLVAALRLGERKGHTPPELTVRVLALLKKLELPHELSRSDLEQCTRLLGHDKKRAGSSIRFVYARAPGDVFTEEISLTELIAHAPLLAES